MTPLSIWTNLSLAEDVLRHLQKQVSPHKIVISPAASGSNLVTAGAETACRTADVAFGQPDPADILASTSLRFIQLSSAGYTRYDNDALRAHLQSRKVPMANASGVYDEPCAQHTLAMILSAARRLGDALRDQPVQSWRYAELRRESRLLNQQTILLVGYGAIARRLAELLQPLGMNVVGVRRSVRGDENIPTQPIADLPALLGSADHVVNILPLNDSTRRLFDANMFARCKPGAVFYNIGRGDTVDQDALVSMLQSGHLAQAWLDVTTPEPLPTGHPLWTAPNCHITPHTAGGHHDEQRRLVQHFINNLTRFLNDRPLLDRIA
jgi:phosphoglycerate dehydrogenase-like enzyme